MSDLRAPDGATHLEADSQTDATSSRATQHAISPVTPTRATEESLWLTPEVDIYDHEDHYTLLADLPGVHERDVELEFEGETLSLCAKVNRKDPSPMLHREYRVGGFRRRFRLAESVDLDTAAAKLQEGVLSVRLPKSRATRRRQIPING